MLNGVIDDILSVIHNEQESTKIITVPGNHDLTRPEPIKPETVALTRFWHDKALRKAFWNEDGKAYRTFISSVFLNYSKWQKDAIDRDVHLRPASEGILPGDASYLIDTPAGQIGVIALNSTWLQLGNGDYTGELHVDVRQLLAVTGNKADEWVRKNEANLLVSHHPTNWLRQSSPSTWENDINPPGRFDIHLFGHMHEPITATVAHGGGLPRNQMQAASLFGLETFGDNQNVRIQGYSINQISIENDHRILTSWPRRLVPLTNGGMKLAPDSGQDIDETKGSFSFPYAIERESTPVAILNHASIKKSKTIVNLGTPVSTDLSIIQHHLSEAKAHQKVRRIEQETCLTALRKDRVVWLTSDWGMGRDGFIGSLIQSLRISRNNVYSLDFSDFSKRETFFDNLQTRYGINFKAISETIASNGPSIMVLDDIDISSIESQDFNIETEIETLSQTLADYAADTFLILRSRRIPRKNKFQIVELKALDEADVVTYCRESEVGGDRYAKPDAASTLFRHTDGIPARLDIALRDLEVVALGDLISSNPDFGNSSGLAVNTPAALVATITELSSSSDRSEQRAYKLLLALAALPMGEQLNRLKRFLGTHPFGPRHAHLLLERSLIDTVKLTTLDGIATDTTNKALMVPRTVREHIRDTVDDTTSEATDRKALSLYFGDQWKIGEIDGSPTGRRVRRGLCDGYEIQNSNTLVLRTVRRALDGATDVDVTTAIRLATAFIEVLMDGDHFRSAVSLCEDMIRILDDSEGLEGELTYISYGYARSLRMVGRVDEARMTFEALDYKYLSKSQRQSAELGLALCLEKQGDDSAALTVAKRTISINRSSNAALQAKIIIAEQIHDIAERKNALERLLKLAQKKKSHVLASNLMLTLASEARKRGEASDVMLKLALQKSQLDGNSYNAARAIVDLACQPGAELHLNGYERDRLVEAYHFLYNERLYRLFDRCHSALWRVFEKENDQGNLLNLFRHSSFIWRLNRQEDKEATYLAKLKDNLSDFVRIGQKQGNRDCVYYMVRVTAVLGKIPESITYQKP